MESIDLTIPKGAIFSTDGNYSYALWRIWHISKPLLLFIGLNPSKAGRILDDPTITRLIVRCQSTGYGGLLASNLYSLISSDPSLLLSSAEPIGEFTDYYFRKLIDLSTVQLCGWGSFPPVKIRAPKIYPLLTNPYCLGVNSDGEPKHPLYVSYSRQLRYYRRSI